MAAFVVFSGPFVTFTRIFAIVFLWFCVYDYYALFLWSINWNYSLIGLPQKKLSEGILYTFWGASMRTGFYIIPDIYHM